MYRSKTFSALRFFFFLFCFGSLTYVQVNSLQQQVSSQVKIPYVVNFPEEWIFIMKTIRFFFFLRRWPPGNFPPFTLPAWEQYLSALYVMSVMFPDTSLFFVMPCWLLYECILRKGGFMVLENSTLSLSLSRFYHEFPWFSCQKTAFGLTNAALKLKNGYFGDRRREWKATSRASSADSPGRTRAICSSPLLDLHYSHVRGAHVLFMRPWLCPLTHKTRERTYARTAARILPCVTFQVLTFAFWPL